MVRLRRALAVAVGVFAMVGIAYTAFFIYATVFLPHCVLSDVGQAVSPSGNYSASFEQRRCEDATRNSSEVMIGKRGSPERIVAVQVKGTNEIGLTWKDDFQLVVSYPAGAQLKRLGPYGEVWPGVLLHLRGDAD
jgi:hypothetical protein